MTSRLALTCAAMSLALLACHDDRSSTSQAIAVKLRDCGIIGNGKVNPYVQDSQAGQCMAKCRANATCEELQHYYCNDTTSARLRDCEQACLGPQPCADGNGTYRSSEWCNGRNDCSDGSDERNCPEPDQGPKYCKSSGARIYDYQRCDGYDDCGDKTDEENCPNPNQQFQCVRRVGPNLIQEIPRDKVCDLEPDCVDRSDESPDQGCAMLLCK